MTVVSRRDFLKAASATFAVSPLATLSASPYGWPIGIQIFPLRTMIDTDFRGTMTQVADAGFQTVELLSPWYHAHNFGLADMEKYSGAEIQRILGDLGLKATGSHVDMTELRGDELPKLMQWAADRGVTQLCVPSLDGPRTPTMDDVKRLADEYNRIAAATRQAGFVQGLHTEGFELSTVAGRKTYDVLMELLDPALVKFQFQVSTITQGYDPVEYFTRYPGRFVSMHLQDVDMNAPAPPPAPGGGRGRGSARRAIGQGTLDWKAIFTAAKVGGVQNYFVEMDFELAKASVPFLRDLTV